MKSLVALLVTGGLALAPLAAKAEPSELRIPLGAGGFGFLPLHMMKKYELIEKKAAESGLKKLVRRIVPGIGHSSPASQATVVVPEEPTDRP